MPPKRIDTEASNDGVRFNILGSAPADNPEAGHVLAFVLAEGAFILYPDGSFVGPFIANVLAAADGGNIGTTTALNFVGGGGISVAGNQSSPNDPIDLTIAEGGTIHTLTGTGTVVPGDSKVLVDASGGSFAANLQAASDYPLQQIIWFKKPTAANVVTVTPFSGETIDGALTKTLTSQWESFGIWTDGNEWFVVPLDGAGGGGGITHSYLGYNAVGASNVAMAANRIYLKKITVATAGLLTSIGVYIKANSAAANRNIAAGLWDDDGTHASHLIAVASNVTVLLERAGATLDPRWLHMPLGMYLAAGDYWIGVQSSDGLFNLYYDSGSDEYIAPGNNYLADTGSAYVGAATATANQYSMRAEFIS